MPLFPLVRWLPGRFPSQTTPEFLMLKEKYHFGVSLCIIKKHRRPHPTQTSCGAGSWRAKAMPALISSSLPMGRLPRLPTAPAPLHHHRLGEERNQGTFQPLLLWRQISFLLLQKMVLSLALLSFTSTKWHQPGFDPGNARENWGQKVSTGVKQLWLLGKIWELNLGQI